MFDAVLKVAPNNAEGPSVDMDQVTTAAGAVVLREKAVLVGETAVILQGLLDQSVQQTKLLTLIAQIHASANAQFSGIDFDKL